MRKGRMGLQKEVSRIFTGIQVPKKDAPDGKGPVAPKPIISPKHIAPSKPPVPPEKVATPRPPALPKPVQPKPTVTPEPVVVPEVIDISDTINSPESLLAPSPVAPPKPAVTPQPLAPPKPVAAPAPVAPPKPLVPPKPVAPPPKPFTIPEPSAVGVSNLTESTTPPSKQAVDKPAGSEQTAYKPPIQRQGIYEPPPSAPAFTRQPKVEIEVSTSYRQSPLLKLFKKISEKLLVPKPGVSPGRQKATLLMMLVLPLILVVVLVKVVFVPKKPGGAITVVKPADAVAGFDGKINWELSPPLPDKIRDPMVFGDITTDSPDTKVGPVVKGIVFSDDYPIAVVGERIVSVGDVVKGATISKINSDSVEFTDGEKTWVQKVEK